MGYWIKHPSGKIEMIPASEIREGLADGRFSRDTPCVKLLFIEELNPFWNKPFQPLATFPEFGDAVQGRSHAQPTGDGITIAGWLLAIAGALCTAYFFFFYSTAVDSGAASVNNVGLMQNRTLGCVIGIGIAIVGVLMALLGSKKT